MARREPAAYKGVRAMIARRRRERQAALPPGITLVTRGEVKEGDVLVSQTTLQDVFTVRLVRPALARHYVIFEGVQDGTATRTWGHVLDDQLVRR